MWPCWHNGAMLNVRYNSDGSLDTSFDVDGIVTTDFGGNDVARALAIQNDGKIVVAGYTSPDGSDAEFVLARYNANGSLDTSFDSDGKLITTLGSGYDYPSGITIQSDDKIVVVGEWGLANSSSKETRRPAVWNALLRRG